MLVGFRCKNYRSIREEQSLSMLAGPTKNLGNHVTEINGFEILKTALIFGANGAGKSNIFKALRFSSQFIIKNAPEFGPHDSFYTLTDSESKESMFEYEIEIKGRFFRYGFEIILDERRVVGEWLYEFYPEKDDRIIFSRDMRGIVSFEEEEKPFENINGDLFLHNARRSDFWKEKSEDRNIMKDVREWFWKSIAVIGPDASLLWNIDMADEDNLTHITDVVRRFDTGIIGSGFKPYKLGDEPVDVVDNSRVVKSTVKKGNKGIFRQGDDGKLEAFRFKHGEGDFYVNLDQESDGTLRIMKLSPILFRDEEDEDCTYIIDEFDRTLHPNVVRGFVEWFLKKKYLSNKQLIITTHNPDLLDQELVRRDEIWFVQKDSEGGTSLYSLDDFKVRFDKKIEKAYSEGHFGGVPDVIIPEGDDDAF